jgi:hypothetical protein
MVKWGHRCTGPKHQKEKPKSKVVRPEGLVRLEVSRESKFEWAYGLKLARIGQVSIPEQKASVGAALFSHAALAADSMASSDTSTVRIASSLYGAPLNSFICLARHIGVNLGAVRHGPG